jgi:hypothetical protein
MSEWISVKDRLPEDNLEVEFFQPEYDGCFVGYKFVGYKAAEGSYVDPEGNGLSVDNIHKYCTHWRVLPELPINLAYVSATNKIHYYLNFHTRGWEAPNIVWLNAKDFKQMYEEMEELQRSKNVPMWTNQLLVNHGVRSFIFRLSNIALNVDAEPLPDTLEEMKTWNNIGTINVQNC